MPIWKTFEQNTFLTEHSKGILRCPPLVTIKPPLVTFTPVLVGSDGFKWFPEIKLAPEIYRSHPKIQKSRA
jgi:hypothetical protein